MIYREGGKLKKYNVERHETIDRYYSVEIEANSRHEAKEKLWGLVDAGLEPLREEQIDSRTFVTEIGVD